MSHVGMAHVSHMGMSQLPHTHKAGYVAHLIQWAGYITTLLAPSSSYLIPLVMSPLEVILWSFSAFTLMMNKYHFGSNLHSKCSFIFLGLPVYSTSWGRGKRTRELFWKRSQSPTMWKRFVMWRSSWKPQKALSQQIILETFFQPFTMWKMFGSLTFLVLVAANP